MVDAICPQPGWFCDGDRCPSFVGSTPVLVEGVRITAQYSARLADVLAEAIRVE